MTISNRIAQLEQKLEAHRYEFSARLADEPLDKPHEPGDLVWEASIGSDGQIFVRQLTWEECERENERWRKEHASASQSSTQR